jgi:peptidoglycan/LPS O-acetylase OafA/YrhL
VATRTSPSQTIVQGRVRRHDIDWVRIFAVLLLVPFHTARIFNIGEGNAGEPFYAKSEALSWPLSHFINFVDLWHMPLLFAVAGAATWYALGFRSGRQYAAERFKRLLIPFIFGVLVIVPPQTFFGAVSSHNFDGSLFGYWPHFFTDDSPDLTGYAGGFTPAHLWFILYLFLNSILGLALLLYLRRENGQRLVAGLAGWCKWPGVIFLFAVPLLLADRMLSDVADPNPLRHLLFFIAGYLLVANGGLQAAVDRHKGSALLLGIASAVVIGVVSANDINLGGTYAPKRIGFDLLTNLDGWLWIIAILGYGRRFLNANNRVLRYANEAAYPFYILHQTVVVAVGFYMLKLNMGVPASFTLIVIGSLIATLAVYDLIVKRVGVLRFLFGMKERPGSQAVQRQGGEAAIGVSLARG